jgi:nifR3 family TIM-barrel protein
MDSFWENLPTPFFALAPMADVTDAAFRRIITKYGKPDVLWTEFVSADGLSSAGREVLKRDLEFTKEEHPIVAQLFSSHPDKMRQAAKLCAELGFDGIDINMGCPDRSIEKQGAGAAMIKTPDIAALIIQAAKDGIKDAGKDIPVSVKTRVGYNTVQIKEWIPFLLSQDIAALTIHARTRREMSKVEARWEHVREVVEIRNSMGVKTKIIGNGDVRDVAHGRMLAEQTGCDGIMIGRAIFGNPWLFASLRTSLKNEGTMPAKSSAQGGRPEQRNFLARKYLCFWRAWFRNEKSAPEDHKYWLKAPSAVPIQERLRVMIEHTDLFMKLLGDVKNFAIMKKHYKAYVNGFNGAKELRVKLMEAQNPEEVKAIVDEFLH